MFFKKKIEPNVESVIAFLRPSHWADYFGKKVGTFHKKKSEGKIIKAYYPFYKKGEQVGWRNVFIDLEYSNLCFKNKE